MFGPRPVPQPTDVNGLTVVKDVIGAQQEQRLLAKIDKLPWSTRLCRRTQHYGWEYHYDTRTASQTTPMPCFLTDLYAQLCGLNLADAASPPDQVIITEYLPGQGIGAHTDAKCFDDTITTLSLGSATAIDYELRERHVVIRTLPRSVTVMRGKARREWTHAIASRKHDRLPGTNARVERGRRVSITFRRMQPHLKANGPLSSDPNWPIFS